MNKRKYYNKVTKWTKSYEKRAYKELKRVFNAWGRSINYDALTPSNYESVVTNSLDLELMSNALVKIYLYIGNIHGKRINRFINNMIIEGELKNLLSFEERILQYLERYMSNKIVSISATYTDSVNQIIRQTFNEGGNLEDVIREIRKLINKPSFYRWQAERIARTETAGATNFATVSVAEDSDYIMEKEWLSSEDSRVRTRHLPNRLYDHKEMNGVKVQLAERFNVNGDALNFPADYEGQPGNIINCRCAVAVLPKRDANGVLIRKN